ncbi:MAG TPA: TIM barrel protein [bacterium]|nr:TIM barrel protein [bacterium]HPN33096.1 TIM barrel protein [bacterium]
MDLAFCLETLYTTKPFLHRLEAARKDGIDCIEIWDWQEKAEGLPTALAQQELSLSNLSANRRFGMVDPSERDALVAEVEQSLLFAQEIKSSHIMLLSQPLQTDGKAVQAPVNGSYWLDHLLETVSQLLILADRYGVDLLIEPLNDLADHPHYLLNSSRLSFSIIRQLHHPRLRVLYDIYHMSVMGENVCKDIEENLDAIGYFHLADLPGRTEPGIGRIPYEKIIRLLKSVGYNGTLGCEFYPSTCQHDVIVRRTLERLLTWIS